MSPQGRTDMVQYPADFMLSFFFFFFDKDLLAIGQDFRNTYLKRCRVTRKGFQDNNEKIKIL